MVSPEIGEVGESKPVAKDSTSSTAAEATPTLPQAEAKSPSTSPDTNGEAMKTGAASAGDNDQAVMVHAMAEADTTKPMGEAVGGSAQPQAIAQVSSVAAIDVQAESKAVDKVVDAVTPASPASPFYTPQHC